MTFETIGKSVTRVDLRDKTTGAAKYASDLFLPNMAYGKVLRSPHPHARIISIDTSAAESLAGVRAVLTPFNAPTGKVAPDVSVLDTVVRFVGDEVAAVAAEDEDIAEEALKLIEVEYEVLPFVVNPKEAIKPGAPAIHPDGNLIGGKPISLTRGDVSVGFEQADQIFEHSYSTPAHSGAALEPRAAVASWEGDKLTVWKSSRGVHGDKLILSIALDIPAENVRVVGMTMGAGYGNKDESRLAAITASLARLAGRPLKIELTREEEFVAGRHRHATSSTVKIGVKNDGTITAIHATTLMDTGAYLSSGPGVVRRTGQGALYLYKCPNVRYDGFLTYTNTPTAGSYRSLGAPQGHFALESTMDYAARALGIDPLEFRLRNHVPIEGQVGERITPANQILDAQPVEGGLPFSSNGLHECLEKGAERFGWNNYSPSVDSANPHLKRGKGMSMFLYRGGVGTKSIARAKLNSDGTVQIITGVMDVGEGALTALSQIAAEELGVPLDQIAITNGDTDVTPDAALTAGSTVTFSGGLAVQAASASLKRQVLERAQSLLESNIADLIIVAGNVVDAANQSRNLSLANIADSLGDQVLEVEESITPGSKDYIVNSFGAHFAEVEVDTETGNVKVLRYVAAQDSGRIINPRLATNQVEGAVSQMMGFTLNEHMVTDERNGVTLNASFLEHKSPTTVEYPNVEVVFADVVDPLGPFGAKAIGEPPSVGVAPAIVSAIRNATGITLHSLPVSPDRILDALERLESETNQQ